MSSPTTITDAAAALRAGEVSAVSLVQECLAVADRLDDHLGMFLARFQDRAIAEAQRVDAHLAAGESLGPLAGIPVGIKDIITTEEGPSTAQSLVLDRAWGQGDAVVVSRLRSAGAIPVGKLTTMEFAIGAPDPAKPFPVPRNPWDPDYWTGGSSSGSGSAVATGAVLGALGTDTAGSIRLPSAYCGISGLMPTLGRVPKSGCVPLGYTLDHIGPMARSARDCALLLSIMAGPDPSDPAALEVVVPDYLAGLSGDLRGVRIGVDRLSRAAGDRADPALAPALDAAVAVLRARGAQISEVELPLYDEMSIACSVIMRSEALAYHLPDLQSRWEDYFPSTRATISGGAFFSAADYVQAQRVRRLGRRRLAELYRGVDLVMTPTTSDAAPSLEVTTDGRARGRDWASGSLDTLHTPYWDAAGNPALSVPIGFTSGGLPLGMQLAGRPFEEQLVLRAGDAFQQDTNWHLQVPPTARPAGIADVQP